MPTRTIIVKATRNQHIATAIINRGPKGADGEDGAGAGNFGYSDLTDATSADIFSINTTAAADLNAKQDSSGLAAVSLSGDYGDLVNVPTEFTPTTHTHTVAQITDFPTLATVATSGDYGDLTNVPVEFTPASHTHTVSDITDFPSLATVATSGDYGDLSNTPIIPSDSQVTDYLVDDGIHTITSSSGVAAPDASNGRSQKFPLTEDVTSFNLPSNLADGQTMFIQGTQDSTARTFSFNASWDIMSGKTASDIASLASGAKFWLSISRYGSTYSVAIATEA